MYVGYLTDIYQWFLVKSDDISIVLVKVFMSPIPFSTLPFPYGVYGVVVGSQNVVEECPTEGP
jgi:hypothetical protein